MGNNTFSTSIEDQMFMAITCDKMKEIVEEDEALVPLLFILALFSPVNMTLQEEEFRLLQHYQQKTTILIYTHLMSRYLIKYHCLFVLHISFYLADTELKTGKCCREQQTLPKYWKIFIK